MHQFSGPQILKCTIQQGKASFVFPHLNRKLKRELTPIIEVLELKSDEDFSHLTLKWNTGQTLSNQIGSIIKAFRNKTSLQSISILIDENNFVDDSFVISLTNLIKNSKYTLKKFKLQIGKQVNKNALDFLSPINHCIKQCKFLQSLSIKVREGNQIEKFPICTELRPTLLKLNLKLCMKSNFHPFSQFLVVDASEQYKLQQLKISISLQQIVEDNHLSLLFLNNIKKLRKVLISVDSRIIDIGEFRMQSLDLEQLSLSILNPVSSQIINKLFLNPIRSLKVLKFSIINIDGVEEQDVRTICSYIKQNSGIQSFSLELVVLQMKPILVANLVSIIQTSPDITLKITIGIQKQVQYKDLYDFIVETVALNGKDSLAKISLQISSKLFSLQFFSTQEDGLKIVSTELNESSHPSKTSLFSQQQSHQIQRLNFLFQQKELLGSIEINPSLFSNYSIKKYEFYINLFKLNLNRLTVVHSNQFQYGRNRLLMNLDSDADKHLCSILSKIEENDNINRLILYHSQVQVKAVAIQLISIYKSRIFLQFVNYFMYSQMQKPLYKKAIKPLERQASKNRIFLELAHSLKQKQFEDYKIFNILSLFIS